MVLNPAYYISANSPDRESIIVDEKTGEEIGTSDYRGEFTPKAKHSLELNNTKINDGQGYGFIDSYPHGFYGTSLGLALLLIFYIAIKRLRFADRTISPLFRKLSVIGWSIIGMMIILCLGLSHIFDDLINYLLLNRHFIRNNYLPYYFLLSGIIIAVFAVAFPKKEKSIITFSVLCFALSAIMKVLSLGHYSYY